jgi:hypothetical protein
MKGVSLKHRTDKAKVFALLRGHSPLADDSLKEYPKDMRTTQPSRPASNG